MEVDMSVMFNIFTIEAYYNAWSFDSTIPNFGPIYMYPCTKDMWEGVEGLENKFELFQL